MPTTLCVLYDDPVGGLPAGYPHEDAAGFTG
jgi:hypothetical protein